MMLPIISFVVNLVASRNPYYESISSGKSANLLFLGPDPWDPAGLHLGQKASWAWVLPVGPMGPGLLKTSPLENNQMRFPIPPKEPRATPSSLTAAQIYVYIYIYQYGVYIYIYMYIYTYVYMYIYAYTLHAYTYV